MTTKKAPAKKATTKAKPVKKAPAKGAKKRATKKAKPDANAKKLSAIDAAAQILAGSNEAMNCKELIETMAKRGLWTSPGGKKPHATLYSAILREITLKGKDARFKRPSAASSPPSSATGDTPQRATFATLGRFLVGSPRWPTVPTGRDTGQRGRRRPE